MNSTSCDKTELERAAYLDGELELTSALAFERHLADCPDCARALDAQRALSEAIAGAGLRHRPSAAQTRGLRGALRRNADEPAPAISLWGRLPAIAALLLVAVVSWSVGRVWPPRGAGVPEPADEVVASHVRSLLAGHPSDVVSTDRHTVKPWFTGKLDYAPVVIDLAADGFPLTGGRLDYVAHRPVAALVYHSDRHVINLFTWPAAGISETRADLTATSRNGFHVVHWTQSGMTWWAVSDVAEDHLRRFAGLLRAAASRESGYASRGAAP
ncbi:MAG TPA: anti-sigma factor [Thermoanaerobaculia bacterium]|jgi:anti-sigma factor RsiW|nr:anti-sigma factor [Thermoanaerobaculia bacterium]